MRFVVAFALALAGCSIQHKSDQYACTKNTDCTGGRICNDGFCVVTGSIDAPSGDGARGDAPSGSCPAPCTSCNTTQKTCTINCQQANCTQKVTCPQGYKCDIQCNTDNACRNGVDCLNAASCSVDCTARQACENVDCGPGPCDVGCSGPQSCRNIRCNNSCACDVVCTGSMSCQQGIQCTSIACRGANGLGCTSVPALCHSCP